MINKVLFEGSEVNKDGELVTKSASKSKNPIKITL